MPLRWNYLLASAALVTYLLVNLGVPLLPVLIGCAAAALFAWWRGLKRV